MEPVQSERGVGHGARRSSTPPTTACWPTATPGCRRARSPQQAGVPLSQVHYHFGSKRAAWCSRCSRSRTVVGWPARPTMYAQDEPLWRRYEQACDFLEDDLESGYVRVLQEMIAAGWSTPEIAAAARELLAGWYELLTEVADGGGRALRRARPVHARRGRHADRQRLHRVARRCCCSGFDRHAAADPRRACVASAR